MSVTFRSNCPATEVQISEPCLCAQRAPGFPDCAPESLKASAWQDCPHCSGCGLELVASSDAPEVNWNNANAVCLLAALGLPSEPYGQISIAAARRACMLARSRGDLSAFERPASISYGARAQHGNVIELGRAVLVSKGIDADGLRARLEQFCAFVEDCRARGATTIFWE